MKRAVQVRGRIVPVPLEIGCDDCVCENAPRNPSQLHLYDNTHRDEKKDSETSVSFTPSNQKRPERVHHSREIAKKIADNFPTRFSISRCHHGAMARANDEK